VHELVGLHRLASGGETPSAVGGLAVHIGARVMAHAGRGEVVVSSTVKDLVVGSGIAFADLESINSRVFQATGVCSPS
jgi:class 3 adenylate cyclase